MGEQAKSGTVWTALSSSEQAEIRAAVDRILSSSNFASATRRSQLLRYLVDRSLAGDADRITEYGIGLDVFQRPDSFEPRMDSIVRTETSRLRQKLRDYYAAEGQSEALAIEIPQRSYAPALVRRDAGALKPPANVETPPAPRRNLLPWMLAAAVVVAAGVLLLLRSRPVAAPVTSLVVLPFQDYSPAGGAEYLADGITEELTNELAQRRELRVVARTSAFVFKGKGVDVREVGRKLNVGAALEGSLAKNGDSVRVTAQLNRTSDGYHLWSHSFEVPFSEIAEVQAQITQSVESAVLKPGSHPAASAGSINPEAHDLYLRASYQLNRGIPEGFTKGLELFQQAVAKDPSYGDAYRGIARAEIALIHITASAPMPAFHRAREALQRALAINPDDGETLGSLADIDYVYDWDWPRAESEFQAAVEHGAQSTTRNYYGWSLSTRGRFAEAHRQLQIAQDLNPLGSRFNQANAFLLEHRFEEAKKVLNESIESNVSVLDSHLILGLTGVYQHDCGQADQHFNWFAQHYSSPIADFGLSFVAACRGQTERVRQLISHAQTGYGSAFTSPYQAAMAYSWIGDKDAAIESLEKSAEAREGQIFYLPFDPAFDAIRADPRYIALEKRIGLR